MTRPPSHTREAAHARRARDGVLAGTGATAAGPRQWPALLAAAAAAARTCEPEPRIRVRRGRGERARGHTMGIISAGESCCARRGDRLRAASAEGARERRPGASSLRLPSAPLRARGPLSPARAFPLSLSLARSAARATPTRERDFPTGGGGGGLSRHSRAPSHYLRPLSPSARLRPFKARASSRAVPHTHARTSFIARLCFAEEEERRRRRRNVLSDDGDGFPSYVSSPGFRSADVAVSLL